MKKVSRKIVSAVTALALTLQFVCIEGLFDGLVKASAFINGKAVVELGDIDINVKNELIDNGDGSYSFILDVNSMLSDKDESTNRLVSSDGYFTAPLEGRYLVEIWGGNGAGGSHTIIDPFSRYEGRGGTGGTGGYIYGIVELDKGDTLWYEVGGNGASTNYYGTGGGANSGGDSGIVFSTGGGGGYTAVYLFPDGIFQDTYLDVNGNLSTTGISASDHSSRYIMIAGGGGGGGAGADSDLNPLYRCTGTPNGGRGGSFGSASVALTGSAYAVQGTVYAGSNGTSSSPCTDYIGRGGTNVPGIAPETNGQRFDTAAPKDWAGNGLGGSANLRGGGGGAGFCGGSAGIQRALLEAHAVGGGGGGSSFVASSVNTSVDQGNLIGTNPSSVGGAVSIIYLDQAEFPQYEDVEINFSGSDYFDISSSSSGVSVSGSDVTISGIDLYETESHTFELVFTPKANFVGGNNVPILDGNVEFSCDGASENLSFDSDYTHVNVPINESLFTLNTYNVNYKDGDPDVAWSDLFDYVDTDALINDFLDDSLSYDYKMIDIVNAGDVSNPITNITSSRVFKISYDVVPKTDSYAEVGEPAVKLSLTNNAAIIYVSDSHIDLVDSTGSANDGIGIEATKSLSFDGTSYVLDLSLSAESMSEGIAFVENSQSYTSNGTFVVPYDGYYAIQAWGGNGGDSGTADKLYYLSLDIFKQNPLHRIANGTGGSGALISGIYYFTAGTELNVYVGTAGNSGTDDNNDNENRKTVGTAGTGGTGTGVELVGSNFIAIAGGGGGAGESVVGKNETNYYNGGSGNRGSTVSTLTSTSPLSAATGGTGGTHTMDLVNISVTGGGKGGSGGASYNGLSSDTSVLSANGLSRFNALSSTRPSEAGNNGACVITFVDVPQGNRVDENSALLADKLDEYVASYCISKYFNVETVEIGGTAVTPTIVGNSDGSSTVNVNIDTGVTVDSVSVSNATDYDQYHHVLLNADFDINVTIYCTPKEGFAGGNDVPLLSYDGNSDISTGISISKDSLYKGNIPKLDPTDYVNVVVDEDIVVLTGEDTTITCGESLTYGDLFEYSGNISFSDGNQWKYDFVVIPPVFEHPLDEEIAPTVTTYYTNEVSLSPSTAATKAVVSDEASKISVSAGATVFVKCSVDYTSLSYITHDGPSSFDINDTINVSLSPVAGYELPDSVSVTVGGVALTSDKYSYSKSSGALIIPGEYTTGNIVISGTGTPIKYDLDCAYQTVKGYDSTTGLPIFEENYLDTESYSVGVSLADSDIVDFVNTYVPTEVTGYTFKWTWFNDGNEAVEYMQAQPMWILGVYSINYYDLTINYYKTGTTTSVHDSYTTKVKYNESYTVASPDVDGYICETTSVSGTMGTSNVTLNVFYTPIPAQTLHIEYLSEITGEALCDAYEETFDYGDSYNVTSPDIDGYTISDAAKASITGTMGSNGVSYTVYYKPNTYAISFNPDGGSVGTDVTTINVRFDDIYGNTYEDKDSEEPTYMVLPEPVRKGYTFDGWVVEGDTTGTIITSESVVSTAGNHTLVATWTPIQYDVSIEYVFEDGTTASDTYSTKAAYGSTVGPIDSPSIVGYTPDYSSVSINVSDVNNSRKVTYTANEHTITINYWDGNDLGAKTPLKTFTDTIKFGDTYEYASPSLAEMNSTYGKEFKECTDPIVQGTLDVDEDLTFNVYYYDEEIIIKVTVEWGDMVFDCTYDDAEWNPSTHVYDCDSDEVVFTPTTDTGGNQTNYIKIFNYSSISLDVDIEYISATGFATVSGSVVNPHFNVARESGSHTEYLSLSGTLPGVNINTITVGECKVTISGGQG